MLINACGNIVQECWYDLPNHYPGLELDIFVVMHSHMHGIIVLADERAGLKPAPTKFALSKPHGLPEIKYYFIYSSYFIVIQYIIYHILYFFSHPQSSLALIFLQGQYLVSLGFEAGDHVPCGG